MQEILVPVQQEEIVTTCHDIMHGIGYRFGDYDPHEIDLIFDIGGIGRRGIRGSYHYWELVGPNVEEEIENLEWARTEGGLSEQDYQRLVESISTNPRYRKIHLSGALDTGYWFSLHVENEQGGPLKLTIQSGKDIVSIEQAKNGLWRISPTEKSEELVRSVAHVVNRVSKRLGREIHAYETTSSQVA